ncbi:unnamed protein product [Phytomonas sp. Hart1]|nr:unnamed protein product [Phytomonas sp. Hart1]|eukprot:CCW66316.1 unnamed protein product [Phytomonas sp. isolate Hart1]
MLSFFVCGRPSAVLLRRMSFTPSAFGVLTTSCSTKAAMMSIVLRESFRAQSQSFKGSHANQWQEGMLDPRFSSENNMRKLNPETMAHYVKATIQNDRREMGLEEVVDWNEFAKDAVFIPTRSGPLWVGSDDPRVARLMRRRDKMKKDPQQKTRPKPGPDPAKELENHPLREYFTTASNLSDPLSVANNLHRAGLIREYDIKFTAAKITYHPRPPIVSIMGHVDHGKTTLLDYLRKTNVASLEVGGITQNVGAFQVQTSTGSLITFIDTPGHAAFTAMREVGASANDLIILVVSAVDGVQLQTVEVVELAHKIGVPMVVAITKIDRRDDCEDIKNQLRQLDVQLEEDGGDVQLVRVCARDGTGVPELLEALHLQAELCEVSTPVPSRTELRVIESKKAGANNEVAAIVECGRLRPGQVLVAGMVYGTVKKVFDEHGEMLAEAGPSTPVILHGFQMAPKPGVTLLQVSSEKHAENFYYFMRDVFAVEGKREDYLQLLNQEQIGLFNNRKPDNNLVRAFSTKAFRICCKAATFGMLQAMMKTIYELPRLEGISVEIKMTEIGGIKNSDVLRIGGSGHPGCFLVYGNCEDGNTLAIPTHITLIRFDVLYYGIEKLKQVFVDQLPKVKRTRIMACAECLQTFKSSQAGRGGNAGGMTVTKGTLDASHLTFRVLRKKQRSKKPLPAEAEGVEEGEVVYEGQVKELRRFKDLVPSVETGLECGVILYDEFSFMTGDVLEQIEVYEESREVAAEYEAAERREKITRETAELQERIAEQQAQVKATEEKVGKMAENLQAMV